MSRSSEPSGTPASGCGRGRSAASTSDANWASSAGRRRSAEAGPGSPSSRFRHQTAASSSAPSGPAPGSPTPRTRAGRRAASSRAVSRIAAAGRPQVSATRSGAKSASNSAKVPSPAPSTFASAITRGSLASASCTSTCARARASGASLPGRTGSQRSARAAVAVAVASTWMWNGRASPAGSPRPWAASASGVPKQRMDRARAGAGAGASRAVPVSDVNAAAEACHASGATRYMPPPCRCRNSRYWRESARPGRRSRMATAAASPREREAARRRPTSPTAAPASCISQGASLRAASRRQAPRTRAGWKRICAAARPRGQAPAAAGWPGCGQAETYEAPTRRARRPQPAGHRVQVVSRQLTGPRGGRAMRDQFCVQIEASSRQFPGQRREHGSGHGAAHELQQTSACQVQRHRTGLQSCVPTCGTSGNGPGRRARRGT
jgi:hypothetical protein